MRVYLPALGFGLGVLVLGLVWLAAFLAAIGVL
jgi:hypothetical protein